MFLFLLTTLCICFSLSQKSEQSKSFLCKCSFIEIYNEQIYDLLDTASASLFLRENIKKGVFVEGAVEKFVNSAAEAYQVGCDETCVAECSCHYKRCTVLNLCLHLLRCCLWAGVIDVWPPPP